MKLSQFRVHIILSIFIMIPFALLSQKGINEVDMESIPYKKVRSYILKQQTDSHVNTFADIQPTCQNQSEFEGFSTFSRTFVIKANLADVWTTYISSSPITLWKTRKSAVGMVYNRVTDELSYSNDTCSGSELGQVMYLNLKLVKGLYKLATALEITDIQDENGVIEISYLEFGKNEGKQLISMNDNGYGYTVITHTSIIKSGSALRDKLLYPYFHNRLINSFHKNMKQRVYALSQAKSSVASAYEN